MAEGSSCAAPGPAATKPNTAANIAAPKTNRPNTGPRANFRLRTSVFQRSIVRRLLASSIRPSTTPSCSDVQATAPERKNAKRKDFSTFAAYELPFKSPRLFFKQRAPTRRGHGRQQRHERLWRVEPKQRSNGDAVSFPDRRRRVVQDL